MRFLTLTFLAAACGLASANASLLQFSAITGTGEIASFSLDTSVPNTYDPILYPNLPVRGVYLDAVRDLNFDGVNIDLTDVATTPGETGDGRPLTVMEVGPLFDNDALSLFLVFQDPSLVTPLSSNPFAYELSFEPFQSVLFPQIPPARTGVDSLLSLTVSGTVNEVPEPSYVVAMAMIALCAIALRERRGRGLGRRSKLGSSHSGV